MSRVTDSAWCILLDGSYVPAREEVGNKARSLALMRSRGLPVPPAFVLPTHVGERYLANGGRLPASAWEATLNGIAHLEQASGRTFGATSAPLLVSVRSGAAQSMPGMMDTVLNLGINDAVEAALATESEAPAFAADTRRRFIESYTATVLRSEPGVPVPDEAAAQLHAAIGAVFASWESRRACAYRLHRGISDAGGTAVVVQAMVFGNFDESSGAGVFFTRNPHSGAPEPYGEFLPGGQGEDVVAGTAQPLDLIAMDARVPDAYAALLHAGQALEREAGDVQDVEFTVQQGRLYLLQSRAAKRSPAAALRLAVDLVEEGLAAPEVALRAIRAEHVDAVLEPRLDAATRDRARMLACGEPACPGLASGVAVGDPDEAQLRAAAGEAVVLARRSTSPNDVHGMIAARGVCTEVGGRTSHAAVVSRELGRPAVVGCGEGALRDLIGETVTIDGRNGEVFAGVLPIVRPRVEDHPQLATLIAMAAEHRDALGAEHPLLEASRRRPEPS